MFSRATGIRSKLRKRSIRSHLPVRPTALASAISLALSPAATQAEDWHRNVEIFLNPGSERTLYGAQYLEPLWQDANSMVYSDLRGNFTNAVQANEVNAGFGYRQLIGDRQWIAGGWVSGDTRSSLRDNRYWQVSGGVEALSDLFDVRANGYLPVTDKNRVQPFATGGFFEGNRLFTSTVMEEALAGVDGEVGVKLPIEWAETRMYVGGHHFQGDVSPDADGAKVRLEVRPWQSMTLGASYEYDTSFGDEAFVNLRYAFGYPNEQRQRTLPERMIQFAERDVDVKTTDRLPDDKMASRTVADRTLINNNVVHIDNSVSAGGDGSFEHPYNTFAACAAGRCTTGSLVYVHAGNGTATGYDQTFTLHDNQKLIGQGFALYGIGGNIFPVLTTAAGNAVVLGNFNEVAGLNINNAAGNGIAGNNITGFNIHDNRIVTGNYGINLTMTANAASGNRSMVGTIANNIINTGGAYGYGVYVRSRTYDSVSGTQSVTLTGNTISTSGVYADALSARALSFNSSTGTQSLTLTGNTISATGAYAIGVNVRNFNSGTSTATQGVTLSNNTIAASGDRGDAIFVNNTAFSSGTATQTVAVSGNTITSGGRFGNGIYANNYGTSGATVTQVATLSNNTVTASGQYGNGVYFRNRVIGATTATQTATLSNNTVSATGNGGTGVTLANFTLAGAGNATQKTTISNSTVAASGLNGRGMYIANNAGNGGTATQTSTVSSSTVTGSSIGVRVRNGNSGGAGTATQLLDLTGTTIAGNINASGNPVQTIIGP